MEEDKNLEQNLDKSNEKLHISDVMKRIDELIEEHRQIPLKMKDCKDSFEYDNLDRRLRSLRMLFIELGILKYVS
jgi:L-fucose isomerase-like protein